MLKQIHIRLTIHGERENIEHYYATTCFFSLNSWKSSAVKVLDISQYLSTDVNDDITLIPGSSSGTNGGTTGSTTTTTDLSKVETGINNINQNIDKTSGKLDNISNKIPTSGEIYMDLKLEWKDIKYNGITLIEAGELNISELVRNNETLSTVHGYIRIIANFIVIMNILKTIYNLILQALGIIEPEIKLEYENIAIEKDNNIKKLNK